MNRMEEYAAMLAQLESVPSSDPVAKAKKRKHRADRVRRSLTGVVAALCVFVGMINVSPTVSAACREIPLLKELVELLTFNPSLRIAIENDYVQMVAQEQTKDDITARIEYLIVDQKQVNVFYTLTSQKDTCLEAFPEVLGADGAHLQVATSYGGTPKEEDGLRQITIDFVAENVPDYLELTLKIRDTGTRYDTEDCGNR